MNLGEAAEELAARLGLAAATVSTRTGNDCRRHIIGAIRALADIPFEWNISDVTTAITGGTNDYALPAGMRCPVILYSATESAEIELISVSDMIRYELDNVVPSVTGPIKWCYRASAIHIWPVPTAAWSLRGIYIKDGTIPDPTYSGSTPTFPADSSTSIWLESGRGLKLTIAKAAANYAAAELKRQDLASSYLGELDTHLAQQLNFTHRTVQSNYVKGIL